MNSLGMLASQTRAYSKLLRGVPRNFFHVKGEKIGASLQENTLDEDFHKFQVTYGSANIARVEMRFPPIVMRVQLGYYCFGRTSQTTLVYMIYFLRSTRMYL